MFGFGFIEVLLISAIALIAIGPKRLPGVAKALGRGLGEFKSALNDVKSSVYSDVRKPLEETKSQYLDNLLADRKSQQQAGPPPEVDGAMASPGKEHTPDGPIKPEPPPTGAPVSAKVETPSPSDTATGDVSAKVEAPSPNDAATGDVPANDEPSKETSGKG